VKKWLAKKICKILESNHVHVMNNDAYNHYKKLINEHDSRIKSVVDQLNSERTYYTKNAHLTCEVETFLQSARPRLMQLEEDYGQLKMDIEYCKNRATVKDRPKLAERLIEGWDDCNNPTPPDKE